MLEHAIGDVLHDVPRDREAAIPPVLLPVVNGLVKVNRAHHLRNADKLPARVYLVPEKKITKLILEKHKDQSPLNKKKNKIWGRLTEKNKNTGQPPDFSFDSW